MTVTLTASQLTALLTQLSLQITVYKLPINEEPAKEPEAESGTAVLEELWLFSETVDGFSTLNEAEAAAAVDHRRVKVLLCCSHC